MRLTGFNSPLTRNVLAAVVSWIAVTVATLLMGGVLIRLVGLFGFGTSAAWLILIAVLGYLAILFGGGFICSRLAASRAGVWLLIALLIVPQLLEGRWGSFFGGSFGVGDSVMGGLGGLLVQLVTLPVSLFLTWLLTILPVLAGANYEERRRRASR